MDDREHLSEEIFFRPKDTPVRAIREYCRYCQIKSGMSKGKLLKDCMKKECPLYPFSPRCSDRTGNAMSERIKKLMREGLLHPFRKGNLPASAMEFLGNHKKRIDSNRGSL